MNPASPSISTVPGGTIRSAASPSVGPNTWTRPGTASPPMTRRRAGVTIDLYEESNGTAGLQAGNGGDTLVASTTTGEQRHL